MRKVSKKIAEAFKARKPASLQNTHTDGEAFFLHGNKIAEWRPIGGETAGDELWISSAGWNTSTTRERLNAILRSLESKHFVHQSKGQLCLSGGPWSGSWVKVL